MMAMLHTVHHHIVGLYCPLVSGTTIKTYWWFVLHKEQMVQDQEESQKRWTAKRRAALVMELLRGDVSVAEAARQHGLTVAEVEEWRERFLADDENALRSRPLGDEAQKEQELKRLKQQVGELVMELDIVKEAIKGHPSLRQMRDE